MAQLKAAIIDLDGVVTQTASVHAEAWEEMLNAYNDRREEQGQAPFQPFSIEQDYPKYVDGMPRYDGVAHFLKSRNIDLPKGKPTDEAGKATICGLGNWKDELFEQKIEQDGVQVFEENVEVIRQWKQQGLKTALISSSRNAQQVLQATGLENLFDSRVDGVVSDERQLTGKPAPDIFLEAAKELQVKPEEALVVEDSLAGVEAAKRGGFQLVIGIGDALGKMKALGADQIVKSLKTVKLDGTFGKRFDDLPATFEHFESIAAFFNNHTVILCFDYDGTLTPIVAQHDQAVISNEMREIVRKIAEKNTVAIVSGRDLRFIQEHMQLKNVYYAGSHGYEITGPDNFRYELEEATNLLPLLDRIEGDLRQAIEHIAGADVERKRFAIAVHYRNVAEEQVAKLKQAVDLLLAKNAQLRKKGGKKVIEVQPNIDWDKGKAVRLLYDRLSEADNNTRPAYIGDDLTDEDAFREIQTMDGLCILVGDHGSTTYADYALETVEDVKKLLQKLE